MKQKKIDWKSKNKKKKKQERNEFKNPLLNKKKKENE